jgi:hypothetical protein
VRRDLLEPEQRNVRTALRYLRVRTGGWVTVAAALHCKTDTLGKIVSGRRGVTASLAVRIARLVEVSIDELLDGRALPSQLCPHCGRPTDNFGDEQTVVEDRPRDGHRKVGDINAF